MTASSGNNFVNKANKYARDIVSGKIDACRYVRMACQSHLDDLSREKKRGFKYKFDRKAAQRACVFIQKLPHTKGKWAAQKKLLVLEPWQLFIICVVFGWKRKGDGLRRYRTIYIEVPRKNGKTALIAGLGLYMFCADGEYGAEVYCGATTEKQAMEVFRPAKAICKKLPDLVDYFGVEINAQNLNRPADNSRFEPVIGDPGDGSSPSCAIHDEVHEHKTSAQIDTMDTGMGAREQPLQAFITTSGYDIEGPCYQIRQEVIDNLEGISRNEKMFGLVYTLDPEDDWTNLNAVKKANPNYGVSVDAEYLENQLQRAISSKRRQSQFKTKHCNLWVQAKDAFINLEKWKNCFNETLSLHEFTGENAPVALDLASKLDLTARVQLFYRDIDGLRHYYCISPAFYIPEDTVYSNAENPKLAERYEKWVNMGVLTPTDGAEVDFRVVKDDILDLQDIFSISGAPIDPHGATGISHDLMDEGIEVITVPQNYTQMTAPMKELEAAIEGGRFHHDGNPIMTWCIGNMIAATTRDEKMMRPVKAKKENKIDGAVALLMALSRVMPDEEEQVTEPMIRRL